MRRLLLLLAATALMVAACGDDTVSPLTQPATAATTAAVSTTGSTETTVATTTDGRDRHHRQVRRTGATRPWPAARCCRGSPAPEAGAPSSAATRIPAPTSRLPAYGDRGSDPCSTSCGTTAPPATWEPATSCTARRRSIRSTRSSATPAAGRPTAAPGARPQVDVTDPYLYGVYDECADGDMAACDTLYLESPAGSHFEWFGYTCGLISDGSVWCVELIPDETNQRLDDLYAACAGGDMQACDDLYLESPRARTTRSSAGPAASGPTGRAGAWTKTAPAR